MTDHIVSSRDGAVMQIRMNRPDKKNALTADMYAGLASALDEANGDDTVRAILILGSPGAFSAGNDIGDFARIAMSGERDSMAVFDFLERIIMAPKPLVAGVDGLAIGVGTTMLLHCDHVVVSDRSFFRTPFVDLGLVPEAGSSLIAPRLIGHHRAFATLVMGDPLDGSEAVAAGFANSCVSADALEGAAMAKAQEIADKPQQSLKISRDLVRGDRSDILARMKEEAVLFGERLQSEEAKAAFLAFMSKGQKKAS